MYSIQISVCKPVNTLIRVSWQFLGLTQALRVVYQFLFGNSKCFPYLVDKTIHFCHCLLEQLMKLILNASLAKNEKYSEKPTLKNQKFANSLLMVLI